MGGMTALLTSSNDLILIGEKREGKKFMVSLFLLAARKVYVSFNKINSAAMPKP